MLRTGALILAGLLIGACAAGEGAQANLAEYVALAGPGVDTTAIFPGPDPAAHLIGLPLPPADDGPVWLTTTRMHVRFAVVTESPRTLLFEARPPTPPGAPAQAVAVVLNGTMVDSREMESGWQEYEFPLPPDSLEAGANTVELRFARTIRPADFDPASNDQRELAARFRRIEIRLEGGPQAGGGSRGVIVDLGADPATAAAGEIADGPTGSPPGMRDFSSATIDMPVGSMTELYLLPRPDTELLGELSRTPGSAAGDVTAHIDVVVDGEATTFWQGSPSDSWRQRLELRADLGDWAGDIIQLRIRVTGTGSASARWSQLRTRSSVAAFDERFGIPEPVRVGTPTAADGRPDIFVVLLDAARADAIFGDRGLSLAPHVAALATGGTSFRQAWAPSAWTGQSVPALLTGMTPDTLGFVSWESRLPAGFDTLPGLMRAAGYRTILFSQHTFYQPHEELLEDFDVVESVVTRDRLPDVEHFIDDERPIFALVHLLPPHDPYDAPPPFGGARSDWYQGDIDLSVDLLRRFDTRVPPDQQDDLRRLAIARYEENVAYADHLVGRFVARLQGLGRYDDAVVVLLSDHGEAFGEHGSFLHSDELFEEFIHVPLVIKWPDAHGDFPTSVEAPVSTIDVAPTLIELAGIDDPRARFQGRSLLSLLSEARPDRLLLSQTGSGNWPRYAVRWGDLKLLYWERNQTARLFNLATDPEERHDLAPQMPLQTQALLQALRVALARNAAVLRTAGDAATEELDAETLRRLRALGYLR